MGQGASVGAGNKLRNILVVKAYNARPKDTSLEEQFAPYVQVDDDNNTFLSSEDVRAALRLEPEQMHRLLQRFGATLGGRIGYGEFMGFLDGQRACGAKQRRFANAGTTARTSTTSTLAAPGHSVYPTVFVALGFVPAPILSDATDIIVRTMPQRVSGGRRPSGATAPGADAGVDVAMEPGTILSPSRRGTWKKREVVVNERIVEYTKVDPEGVVQKLVESEKTQSEIVHIETPMGQFAHKEQTQFEQCEKFNGEPVLHEVGSEQFLHLKSKDDEFSHFESTMPANRQQQPPPQANGNQDPGPEHQGGQPHDGGGPMPMYGDSFGAAPDQAEAHQQQGEEACHAAYSTQERGEDVYGGGASADLPAPGMDGAEDSLHGATSQRVDGVGGEVQEDETQSELHARLEAEAEAEAEAYMRARYGDNYVGADGDLCGGEGAGSDHGDLSDGDIDRRHVWQMQDSNAVPQSPTTTRSADNTTATGSPDSRRWTPTCRGRGCEPPLMPSPDMGVPRVPAGKLRKTPLGAHGVNTRARDTDLDERGAAF